MITALKNWNGKVAINGTEYDNINDTTLPNGKITITLYQKTAVVSDKPSTPIIKTTDKTEYKVTVKQYMTKKATPDFDFMEKWNNNNPMPLRTMVGTVEKETKGMVYMKLHGQGEPVITCLRCGKELTNPISRHYGIGPECMCKLGLVADITDVAEIKKQLVDITWEGWLIKSAITNKEEV